MFTVAVVVLSVATGWIARRLFGPGAAESSPSEPPAVARTGSPRALSRGALLYQAHCAKCHGPEGRGDEESMARLRPPPRDFAERPWRYEMTFDSIRRVIADGIPGTAMAAQWTALKPEEIDLLASHVLQMTSELPFVKRQLTPLQQELVALGFEARQPFPAPDLTIEDFRGTRLSLADTKGSWVVLEFWGQFCEPCRASLPKLQRLAVSETAKRLKIIPVCADADDARSAQELLSEIAPGLTAYVDATGIGMASFGVQTLPMAWLINPDGLVEATRAGAVDWDSARIRAAFEAIGDF